MAATVAAPKEQEKLYTTPGYRRPLHWVFKIGSLKDTMGFYEKEFGMHLHRHEEFASGCEATCNGPYGGAWSKTMAGFGSEDENFALELTANYGIDKYEGGNDYRYIAIDSRAYKGPASHVKTNDAGQKLVYTPDGYGYLLVDVGSSGSPPKEPILFVSINVSDLEKSKKYYTDVLGAHVKNQVPGALGGDQSVLISFDKGPGVGLELVQLPKGQKVEHKEASGRFATETEDKAPDQLADSVKKVQGTILHGPLKLQPHGEEVVIIADPDGYEYCFVEARGYRKCIDVRDSKEGTTVDWAYRDKLEKAARSGKQAKLEVAKVLAGDYNQKEIKSKLDDTIQKNPVVVFTQTSCPYCAKAKELLSNLGARYTEFDVDKAGQDGYAYRVELNGITGRSTVPNIFIAGKSVGGFNDGLEALQKEGKLEGLLKEAKAL